MSRAWKITSRYPLLHVNRFRHRQSWNAKKYREKILGMKNHFDINGSIEIRKVDIVGVACIPKWQLEYSYSPICYLDRQPTIISLEFKKQTSMIKYGWNYFYILFIKIEYIHNLRIRRISLVSYIKWTSSEYKTRHNTKQILMTDKTQTVHEM